MRRETGKVELWRLKGELALGTLHFALRTWHFALCTSEKHLTVDGWRLTENARLCENMATSCW